MANEEVQKVTADIRLDQDIIQWFTIEAISLLPKKRFADLLEGAARSHDSHKITYDIVFTINGVNLPFEETLRKLYEQFNRAVEERAVELFKERTGQQIGDIEGILERAKNELLDKFPLARREW